MFRVITGGTHRRYTEAVQTAGRVPGLQAELTDTREQLATYRAQYEDDQQQIHQLEGEGRRAARQASTLQERVQSLQEERNRLHLALEAIASALVTAPDAERARQEAARLVLSHGDRLVLGALAEDLDLLCLGPAVHLYLRGAEIRSAHTTREAARRAAEAEGANPSGWVPGRTVESVRDDVPLTDYATRSLPVQGAWPDRGRIFVLVREDGRPFSAHGTAEAADALAETVLAAHGLTLARTELAVDTARTAPAPA
jgi:FtsZ-binding cell division protein ZapB